MPKPGVPQSRARRDALAAKAEARRPIDDEGGERPRSALAAFMRRPSKYNEQRLRAAASGGELTTVDVQAALAEDVMALTRLAGETASDITAKRPLYVARQRTLKLLVSVIEAAPTSGSSVLVQLVWPSEYAGEDRGDQVRTKDEEASAEVILEAPAESTVSDDGGAW